MISFRSLSATAICASSLFLLSGCDVTILPLPAPSCIPGPMEVCHTYRDAWGRRITECRTVYDRCASHGEPHHGGHHGIIEAIPALTAQEAAQTEDRFNLLGNDEISAPSEDIGSYLISPARMAKRFGMSVDSAILVVDALQELNNSGNTSKLLALGFDAQDLENMSQMKLPEEKSIENVSKILNQDKLFTRAMLSMIRVWATWKIQQQNQAH